jgi:hypothetical protein
MIILIGVFMVVVSPRLKGIEAPGLLNELYLAGAPGLFNPGFERTVDPKDGKPALSRYGFEPIVLIAFGGLRSEVDVS